MRTLPAATIVLAVVVAGCGSSSPRTLRLTCADSKGAPADLSTLPLSSIRVGRLYLPALRDAAGAKLVPWGDGLGWKEYAIVAPGSSRAVLVTLLGDRDEAALYYGKPVDPATYRLEDGYRRVSFGSCGRKAAGYPGGIIVRRPSCVRLRIESSTAAARARTVPIGAHGC